MDSIAAGSVQITSIMDIDTKLQFLPADKIFLPPVCGYRIGVADMRESGGDWMLYAYIISSLCHDGQEIANAADAESGNSGVVVLSAIPVLVYTGSFSVFGAVTTVEWKPDTGKLFPADDPIISGNYMTEIYWSVEY